MKIAKEAKQVIEILQTTTNILSGTLNRLTQRISSPLGKKGKARSYWYLTWKEKKQSKAVYIPDKEIAWVKQGVRNMKKLKQYLTRLGYSNLMNMKEVRNVKQRRSTD